MASRLKARRKTPKATSRPRDGEMLAEIVRRIVELVHPEQIILFGSRATGRAVAESDLDLLVVKSGVHRRSTAQRLYRGLRGIRVPVDLIVATPTDLKEHGADPGLIYSTILRDGKVLYPPKRASTA